ncbi:MAG: enoyl-ACP reductase [Planctomycetota bacterium]
MSFLALEGKTVLVAGVANKKSVAWHVAQRLIEAGARVVYTVHTQKRRDDVAKLAPSGKILVCDVADAASIDRLRADLEQDDVRLDGFVHSIAHASYARGPVAFHETDRADFLRAVDVSCYSLIALANALKGRFTNDAAVVALSISTTRMAALNYGYMAPVKAALDSAVVFLAKSFSAANVRFNSVNAGLLKTSSSGGIPGYVESYLYAQAATLRKRALATEEVADAVLFLLSPRSSGINAQSLVVDAGMSVNYFDEDIVRRATRVEERA